MQTITEAQGDAILDVVQECRVVTQAWDQHKAAQEAGEVEEVAEDSYTKALHDLTDLYVQANQEGVADEILIPVLTKHLPDEVFNSLIPKAAA